MSLFTTGVELADKKGGSFPRQTNAKQHAEFHKAIGMDKPNTKAQKFKKLKKGKK
jgi:hypothetical protein